MAKTTTVTAKSTTTPIVARIAVCLGGECVPLCAEVEYPCSPDRICQDGVCLLAACASIPVRPGQLCDAKRQLLRSLLKRSPVSQAQPANNGVCQDCYSRGCFRLERSATVENARPDPCQNVPLRSGPVLCQRDLLAELREPGLPRTGRAADWVQCVADACADISCAAGSYCDPATGQVARLLRLFGGFLFWPAQYASRQRQVWSHPCEVVRCQDPETCAVQPDGHAECVLDQQVVKAQVKAGSRGLFSCTVGGRGDGDVVALAAWMLALLGLVRSRVRSEPTKGAREARGLGRAGGRIRIQLPAPAPLRGLRTRHPPYPKPRRFARAPSSASAPDPAPDQTQQGQHPSCQRDNISVPLPPTVQLNRPLLPP